MKKPRNSISAVFLYCRLDLKISQRTMARILKINQSSVCRIEKGIISPGKRIRKRLERYMKRSLSDIAPEALRMRDLLEEAEKCARNSRSTVKQVTHSHLSAKELNYLKAKWSVLIAEAETTLSRRSYRLNKLTKKVLSESSVRQHLNRLKTHQQQLITYLALSKEGKALLPAQTASLQAFGVMERHLSSAQHVPVEVFLRQTALEEMEMIRNFRSEKLREVLTMTG